MRNKILITVGAIILFALTTGITVIILSVAANPTPSPDSSTVSHQTSQSIIHDLQEAPIASLAALTHQVSDAKQFAVSAQPENARFTIAVPADAVAVYQDATKDATLEKEAVLRESKKYFTDKGLAEKATSDDGATYIGTNVSCQVQVQTTGYATVSFVCVDTATQRDEYEMATSLINLYNQAMPTDAISIDAVSTVSRAVQKKNAVEGAMLSLMYKEPKGNAQAGLVLLFGSIDNKWEYVANVSDGSNTGKANVPESALKAIRDEKWQGVLAGLVGV